MKEFDRHTKIDSLMLTDQEKRFCERYVEHFNKARAVRESGSKTKYPSQQAAKYLEKSEILQYIEILKEDAAGRVDLRLDRVLKEQMRIGFSNMAHFVRKNRKSKKLELVPPEELGEDDLAALQEIIITDTKAGSQKTRIKLHPKQPALDTLLKFIDSRDGDGDKKKGNAKTPTKLVQNNINFNEALTDPKTRKALEVLTNLAFEAAGMGVVPSMSPAMQKKIAELSDQHLVEYSPPPAKKVADSVDPEDEEDPEE